MARLTLVCALVTLWGVCGGYRILESKEYLSDYTTEPTEYINNDFTTEENDNDPTPVEGAALKGSISCVEDGIFPHPEDCGKFFICSQGQARIYPCNRGLHFNRRTKRCNHPSKARCSPGYITNEYLSDYTTEPTEYINNDFATEENDNDPTPVEGAALKGSINCVTDGIFPHPEDCGKFFICSQGWARIYPCDRGLHFNRRTKTCDDPSEARCSASYITNEYPSDYTTEAYDNELEPAKGSALRGDINCVEDGVIPHPEDCGKFVLCVRGRATIVSCPQGLHINRRNWKCEDPSEARCSPSYISKHYLDKKANEYPSDYTTEPTEYINNDFTTEENDNVPEPAEGPAHKGYINCVTDGLFPYAEDCGKFVQCSHGHAYIMPCPQGLHFNRRSQRCDWPCEARCSPIYISKHCHDKKVNEACYLPCDRGQCKWHIERYYYDTREKRCKKFIFGGCHGNGNNFKSEKQCLEVCGQYAALGPTTQDSDDDAYQTADPWEVQNHFNFQDTTTDEDFDRTPENPDPFSFERRTGNARTAATEAEEDSVPQEQDSWRFPITWRGEDGQTELPEFPTEGSTSTEYSGKARIAEGFQCRGQGAYRNPDDCASFIWCPLDRAIVVPCPPNTHYSEQREECVDPCLAHCNTSLACTCGWPECHQYSHLECESDPDAGPCPDRTLRYYYDRESGKCKSFYYGGCQGNGNNYRTLKECQRECQTSLLAGFRCPSYNGDFGHYPDCVSYYQCKRGIPTLKRCPQGHAFHHLKSKCVPEQEAMCVYECREANAVYPAPKDCRSYIDCTNGIPKLTKCPRGLAFDAHKGRCVPERSTSCTWF